MKMFSFFRKCNDKYFGGLHRGRQNFNLLYFKCNSVIVLNGFYYKNKLVSFENLSVGIIN